MFKVRTEYRKGVLFVRLVGRLDNGSFLENISQMIDDFGIRCVVFNLNDLNGVSLENVEHIIQYQKEMLEKNKLLMICDASPRRNRLFKSVIPKISNELEAFSYI